MKLLALIALAAVGIVIVRRRRPDIAERIEGAAKDAAGQLNGDHALRAEGKARSFAGRLRGKARSAVS
jgi:uncharacterized protein YjbJ (UPF0337 family)